MKIHNCLILLIHAFRNPTLNAFSFVGRELLTRKGESSIFRLNEAESFGPDDTSFNKQGEYGVSLSFPESYIKCARCQATFALAPEDLGTRGKGCRVECSVCSNSWYQTRDKIYSLREGYEFVPLPEYTIDRVKSNIEAGRDPSYVGNMKLFVGNLSFECTEDDIYKALSEKGGEVGDVHIVKDPQGRSKGFAFVTMMTKEGGNKCLELEDFELFGRNVVIREPNN